MIKELWSGFWALPEDVALRFIGIMGMLISCLSLMIKMIPILGKKKTIGYLNDIGYLSGRSIEPGNAIYLFEVDSQEYFIKDTKYYGAKPPFFVNVYYSPKNIANARVRVYRKNIIAFLIFGIIYLHFRGLLPVIMSNPIIHKIVELLVV